MIDLVGEKISDVYPLLLKAILNDGEMVNPRGFMTKEILNVHIQFDARRNAMVDLTRGLNYRFMVAEWVWMMFGLNSVEPVARFNSELRKFSDDGETFWGAYGPRWVSQFDYVVNTLKKDPTSRQAVVSIWTPNPPATKDVPCTLIFQFLIRNSKLNAIVTMRSSDGILGLPYDAFNFGQLTNLVAANVGCDPGFVAMNLGSSHIYDKHFGMAQQIVDGGGTWSLTSPKLTPTPPSWLEHALISGSDLHGPPEEQGPWLRYYNALISKNKADAFKALDIS